MSYVICSVALIVLIFTMQFFYLYVVDNLKTEMIERQLKEVADYTSDTLTNLYLLANSTSSDEMNKTLELPSTIADSTYVIEIVFNTENFTEYVQSYLEDKPWISATSWLMPGLKVDPDKANRVESGENTLVAGCRRIDGGVVVWLESS